MDFFYKYKDKIILSAITIIGITLVWIFLWLWAYIIADIINLQTPGLFQFNYAINIIWECFIHITTLLLISLIYILVLATPIPLAIYLGIRNRISHYILLIPVCFYGTILIDNLPSGVTVQAADNVTDNSNGTYSVSVTSGVAAVL